MGRFFSWRTLCFAGYGLLLTVVLAWLRFPADNFRKYIERSLSKPLSGAECNIGKISYEFPVTLNLEKIKIQENRKPGSTLLSFESIKVSTTGPWFWRSTALESRLYGGEMKATVRFEWAANDFELEDIRGEGIDLLKWEGANETLQRKTAGTLSFSGNYSGSFADPLGGKGEGRWLVEKARVELLQPVLALNSLDLSTVNSKVKYEGNVVTLLDGDMAGVDMAGVFKGHVDFFPPTGRTNIDIIGHLTPQPAYFLKHKDQEALVRKLLRRYNKETLPFHVGGTVHRPTFRFGNT